MAHLDHVSLDALQSDSNTNTSFPSTTSSSPPQTHHRVPSLALPMPRYPETKSRLQEDTCFTHQLNSSPQPHPRISNANAGSHHKAAAPQFPASVMITPTFTFSAIVVEKCCKCRSGGMMVELGRLSDMSVTYRSSASCSKAAAIIAAVF